MRIIISNQTDGAGSVTQVGSANRVAVHDAFLPVSFKSTDGRSIHVSLRDGGFEISGDTAAVSLRSDTSADPDTYSIRWVRSSNEHYYAYAGIKRVGIIYLRDDRKWEVMFSNFRGAPREHLEDAILYLQVQIAGLLGVFGTKVTFLGHDKLRLDAEMWALLTGKGGEL